MQLSIFKIDKEDITEGYTLVIYHCGDDGGEVPPVLIPNTEVKLLIVDNTWLATVREDRTLLDNKIATPSGVVLFFVIRSVPHVACNMRCAPHSIFPAVKISPKAEKYAWTMRANALMNTAVFANFVCVFAFAKTYLPGRRE